MLLAAPAIARRPEEPAACGGCCAGGCCSSSPLYLITLENTVEDPKSHLAYEEESENPLKQGVYLLFYQHCSSVIECSNGDNLCIGECYSAGAREYYAIDYRPDSVNMTKNEKAFLNHVAALCCAVNCFSMSFRAKGSGAHTPIEWREKKRTHKRNHKRK